MCVCVCVCARVCVCVCATFEPGEIVIYWNSLEKLLEALSSPDTEVNSWRLDCCAQYILVCTQHNSNEIGTCEACDSHDCDYEGVGHCVAQ